MPLERAAPDRGHMPRGIGLVTLVVREYDEALAFFVGSLGFELLEDVRLGEDGKRWVVVRPAGSRGAALLLARASNRAQAARIGDQAGGRVFLFLYTDDLAREHRALAARGVRFLEEPREEPYGRVVVFADLYGNRWDLIEPRGSTSPRP